tara:strand:- start:4130 stop:4954 length:825 start_codon:yes stop_codon:yes gene_type:complete
MIRIRTYLYKITFVLIFVAAPSVAFAQLTMGADGLALGQATTSLQNNSWAIFSNPATINNESKSISFFSLRNYGFEDLTDIAATGSIPTSFGIAAFGFHRYGGDLFNETRARLGYANSWDDLKFGVVLNYNHISQASPYGSGGALGIDLGVSAKLTEGLWLGARTSNLNQPQYNFEADEESLSRELALGLSYDLDQNALFLFDVVKDVRFPVSYRGGIEVKVIENLKGRVGVTTEPNTYSFGIGYGSKLWEANLAFQRHETLGFSPGIDLNFFF